jgi:hypothetical protein
MHDNLHLADHETLLLSAKPSISVVITEAILGLFEGVVLGLLVWFLGTLAVSSGENEWFKAIPATLAALVFLGACVRRIKASRHTVFTVTSDRILALTHDKIFFHKLHTLKWNQYQECTVGRPGPLDVFSSARALSIRYGNADSKLFLHVTPIAYASDVKHYLDKIDGLIRRNSLSEVRPFIAKPKGKRS